MPAAYALGGLLAAKMDDSLGTGFPPAALGPNRWAQASGRELAGCAAMAALTVLVPGLRAAQRCECPRAVGSWMGLWSVHTNFDCIPSLPHSLRSGGDAVCVLAVIWAWPAVFWATARLACWACLPRNERALVGAKLVGQTSGLPWRNLRFRVVGLGGPEGRPTGRPEVLPQRRNWPGCDFRQRLKRLLLLVVSPGPDGLGGDGAARRGLRQAVVHGPATLSAAGKANSVP